MESNKKLDLTLKCLSHVVFGSESTQRAIESTGENLPDTLKKWRPAGNFPSIFSGLGIEVKEFTESSRLPAQKIVGASSRDKEVSRIDRNREKYGESCRTPPPIIQQIKPAPLRNRLAGISTFNPPRRVSPAKSAVKNPAPEVKVPVRDSRFYPPSVANNKLSLYETYEEKKSRPAQSSQKPVTFENVSNVQSKLRAQTRGQREDDEEDHGIKEETGGGNPFRTAHEQLIISDRAKGIKRNISSTATNVHAPGLRKVPRVEPPPPAATNPEDKGEEPISDNPEVVELMQNPAMKNIDPKMVEAILNEVLDAGSVDWHDIAGLEGVKNIIKEIILKPMLRPDIFTGLRAPPKGILLFGPPGTGKTMIGRLIATRSKFSFFNISASSLTSKWIGDGEKMVRALFAVARAKQPAVVFIDEIDSILTQRSDNEHESSRRLKTEFLIQFDGCGSKSEDRILIIGVTNRPRELDDAARRRFVKRIYIPLPDIEGRQQLVKNLIKDQKSSLDDAEYEKIAEMTEGYSGADMATLCQEAAYGPIRDVDVDIENISLEDVRPINLPDFEVAMELVKPSVDPSDLCMYEEFDRQFGCQAVKPRVV